MTEVEKLIQATIAEHIDPEARLVAATAREGGPQGYSGATLNYYDVTYDHDSATGQTVLVVKDAPLVERRALAWLDGQDVPVPFSRTLDLSSDVRRPVCMQFVGDRLPAKEQVGQVARALAAVHAAGLKRQRALDWLPKADAEFYAGWLIQNCWRESWQKVLASDEPFTDAFSQWGPAKPGGNFPAEFAAYSEPLEEAAGRFLETMNRLWEEGDSLTLINGDFHSDHARTFDGREYLIDWGEARFGSLYIDLPNYFSREDGLLYRDALAELGHDIPAEQFLANYDAVRPYPGFKYFSIGLWNWRYGDPPHQARNVYHFMKMILPGVGSGA